MTQSPLRQIKASAGSGKTYALTRDILALLARCSSRARSGCAAPVPGSTGWPEILGITFTNRAAAEMKARVLGSLKGMALGESRPETGWTQETATLAVENLIRDASALNIRTIDSLIHLIVRLSALDLDLPPDFEAVFSDSDVLGPLLDDLAEKAREGDEELRGEFARACRQLLLVDEFKGFLAGDRVRSRIGEIAALFLQNPSLMHLQLSSQEQVAGHLTSLRQEFRKKAGELRTELKGFALNHYLEKALDKACDPYCPDNKLPSSSSMFRKESLDECLNKPGKKGLGKGQARPQAHALYEELCDAASTLESQGKILAAAMRLLPFVQLAQRVVKELPLFQHGAGTIPATSIPALAGMALSGEYGVNEAFCRMGTRLTHILIDEFQDTSRSQWNALKPLVEEALSRQGSLTIVGDTKQAIYGWREGDADLFDEVPEDPDLTAMIESPLRHSLPANWRSRSDVIAWNNAFFSRLQDVTVCKAVMHMLMREEGDETLLERESVHLNHCFSGCGQDDGRRREGGAVRLSMLPDCGVQEMQGLLGQLLPARIQELGERYEWSDICVLTQTNDQTARVARWLLEAGIPVVTQGSLLLCEQPLIAQLVALLTFLDSPDDDTAFWAVLSGKELLPFHPDLASDALHHWAVERLGERRQWGRVSLFRAFRQDFPAAWESLFAPLYDDAGLLTPYDAVHEILRHWQVRERHPQAQGFVLRFLEVLYLAEEKGHTDVASFLRYWGEKGAEEKAPLPESMNAVSIMTIHKAKGLEAEVILVPWPNFSLRDRDEKRVWQYANLTMLAPLSSSMGLIFQEARAKNAREAMNLLYVAWTRAISELHCFVPHADSDPMAAVIQYLLEPLLAEGHNLSRLDAGEWLWGAIPSRKQDDPVSPIGTLPGQLEEVPTSLDALLPSPQAEPWRPMHWLPRLKIFRNPLDDWVLSPRRRGTMLHHCLEFLHIGDNADLEAAKAVRRGLAGIPLARREDVEQEFIAALRWYAELPQARVWLRHGSPEHSLLDEEGATRRVDLLVNTGKELVAVEYKSGGTECLPLGSHVEQLKTYLGLLQRMTELPVSGVLVYLDRQQLFSFGDTQ